MSTALVIFSRYPGAGPVKTRLAPRLDQAQRRRLQRALLWDTLERMAPLPVRRVLLLAGVEDPASEEFSRHPLLEEVEIGKQEGDDLGERMWKAYHSIHQEHTRVIFVGTDCPSLPLAFVREALDVLEEREVVLGPVEDGGYYLVGLSRPRPELFRGIDWGTPQVLRQTLARLERQAYHLLPLWYDVDLPADLGRLAADLRHDFEGFPRRTAAFLESLEEA